MAQRFLPSSYSQPVANSSLLKALIAIGVILAAAFAGMIVGMGNYVFDALVVSAISGVLALMFSANALIVVHAALSVVISGCIVYFLNIKVGYWIPFGSAILLGVKVILESLTSRKTRESTGRPPLFLVALGAYFFGIVVCTVANKPPFFQLVVGIKNSIPCWAGFFAVAYGFVTWSMVERLWLWLIALPIAGFPIVLYQHFIIGAGRSVSQSASRFDAVVGTFGGNPEAGGHSATLGLYMVACMVTSLTLYRAGKISKPFFWAAISTSFLSIVLSENKAAFILIPLAFIVCDFDNYVKRPAKFILVGLVMAIALGLMYKAYTAMYYDTGIGTKEAADRVDYFFDPNLVNRETGEVGRFAALAIWYGDPLYTPIQRIFGYGPAASRAESSVEVGQVAKRYIPWRINATTVSQLLWDQGIFGLVSYLGVLIGAVVYGMLRYRWNGASEDRELLRAATAINAVLVLVSLHNSHLSNYMQDQFLLTLTLGTALAAGRRMTKGAAATRREQPRGRPGRAASRGLQFRG